MADTIFEQYVVCKWEAKGKPVVGIPVARITERVEKRVVSRRRAYRKGAKQDSTSRDFLVWELEAVYFNGGDEDGLKNDEMYPDELNRVCDTIDVDDTGTLTLPTRGPRRCQFKGYTRVEDAGMVDAATITMTFWEDNEDSTTASSFSAPSARSVSKKIAQQATFATQKEGGWGDALSQLNEFAAGLEALANGPGEFVDDMNAQANAVANKCEEVEQTFTNAQNRATGELSKLLTNPEGSTAGRMLRRLSDTAKRVTTNVTGATPKIVTRRFPNVLSIFDIATMLQQDASKLMAINPGLPEPLEIPAGTFVRVFDLP